MAICVNCKSHCIPNEAKLCSGCAMAAKSIADIGEVDLLAVMKEARRFVDDHSEKWYAAGQVLLAKLDKAIAKLKDNNNAA